MQTPKSSRVELVNEMTVFGLEKIERKRKEKNQLGSSTTLPKVGTTVDKKAQRGTPRDTARKIDWVEDPVREDSHETKAQDRKINYLCDKLKSMVTKARHLSQLTQTTNHLYLYRPTPRIYY